MSSKAAYFALVDHREGSAYGASRICRCPFGATMSTTSWPTPSRRCGSGLEDMPMPDPSTHVEIIGRADVWAELAVGAC